MKKLILFTSIGILTACASPTPMPSGLSSDERSLFATKECKRVIQINNLNTNFDAFYSNGQFRYIGSARERFNFEKCVTDYGVVFKPSDLVIEHR